MSEGQRWMWMLRRFLRPEVVGTETWTGPPIGRRSSQRAAAEWWLKTAASPQARTAAIQRRWWLGAEWPTA